MFWDDFRVLPMYEESSRKMKALANGFLVVILLLTALVANNVDSRKKAQRQQHLKESLVAIISDGYVGTEASQRLLQAMPEDFAEVRKQLSKEMPEMQIPEFAEFVKFIVVRYEPPLSAPRDHVVMEINQ